MEGFSLNLSRQQQSLFSSLSDCSDKVIQGDTVIMQFFHGGYFEGVLGVQDDIEDDDKIGLGFGADNESYCSIYFADRVVLKSKFNSLLDDACILYPNKHSDIRTPTEDDASKIKMKMILSVAQAIRHAGHDMNVVIPTFMTNPTQDAELVKAISNYYNENFSVFS